MMNLLGDNVSAQNFLMVFICVIIIAVFVYKEYPEFKRRIRGDIDEELESKTVEGRLGRLEKRMTEVSDMLSRDYQRINAVERVARDNTRAIKDSLEERMIIMASLEACLLGLKDMGTNANMDKANANMDRAISDIHSYLNAQAHNSQSIVCDIDANNQSTRV